jgi:uncharacterized protein (DUF2252 family)
MPVTTRPLEGSSAEVLPAVPHPGLLSRDERHALGKAARERVSRESHADLTLPPDRDALAILKRQDATRIPFLVPERHRRMAVDPFAYLRGAAAVMAADFAAIPKTGLTVQAAGDAHIMNFGSFISPEGRILFDVNDFDETLAGIEFHVDVRRLAASLAVAAHTYGFGARRQRRIAAHAVKAYREMMRHLAALSPYEVWRQRIDLTLELDRIDDRRLRSHIAECLEGVASDEIENDDVPHLDPDSAQLRFEDRGATIFHDRNPEAAALIEAATLAFRSFPPLLLPERRMLLSHYRLVDTALKVVGVGSVGTLCAIGLYASPDKELLVMQLKEAQASVNVGLAAPGAIETDQGRRVVEGQRALQAASDVFLSLVPPLTGTPAPRHFYVRHLKTQRLQSLENFIARDIHDADALTAYGQLCGRTLARAHARTGDAIAIAAYLGSSEAFDDAIAAFAVGYVGVDVADHAVLKQEVNAHSEAKKAKS